LLCFPAARAAAGIFLQNTGFVPFFVHIFVVALRENDSQRAISFTQFLELIFPPSGMEAPYGTLRLE
jgi:hypothetical protein